MAVPMSLIISEASVKTILEKGHINIPTATQGHAYDLQTACAGIQG